MDVSKDFLALVEDRLNKLPRKPEVPHPVTKAPYNFPNGETFSPRASSAKRNKPKRLHHAQSFSTLNTRAESLRLYSMRLDVQNTLARSNSMIQLPSSCPQLDLSFGQSLISLGYASSNQSYLTRSPSMSNVLVKKRELAASIRTSKFDTPTNIDISALQPSVQLQLHPHRNSLKNNRYQKGSNNIVDSELSLISTGENTPDSNAFRTFSIGNNSSHSAKGGSDATPSSNPSSVSNYNVNRSDSNTPETSISASESALDALLQAVTCKPENDLKERLQPTTSEESPSMSSPNSSFASADEYPSDDSKLTWGTSQDHNCASESPVAEESTVLELTQKLPDSASEKILNKEPTNQTGYSTGSSDKTVTPNSELNEAEATQESESPSSNVIESEASSESVPAVDSIQKKHVEGCTSSAIHSSVDSDQSMMSPTSQRTSNYSKDVGYDSDRTITKPESLMSATSNLNEAIPRDQSLRFQDENPADMLALKQPHISLNQRRNPGLTLTLSGIRSSFVDFPTAIGTPTSQTSLPSVLKSADGDLKSPLTAPVLGIDNSPASRLSIYSPVQIEKFLTDNQEEVPPRGDIVMMEVHKRSSSVSSFGSVLPSPIVLPTKSSTSSQRATDDSDSVLKNRLSLLGVVNVDFDKSLPSSPAIENVNQKWTLEELNMVEKKIERPKPVSQARKPEKSKSGFRKMLKMFSKSNASQNKPTVKTEILYAEATGKKKFLNLPVMLSSRLSPTYSVRERKMPIEFERSFEESLPPLEKQKYDLPPLEFEELFFNDVMVKFDEVEQQAQNEVDQLKRNNSLHNVFLKDDELSKDQIANQQQKDAGNSDDFLPIDERSRLDGDRFYENEPYSEEFLSELPLNGEQSIVLTKTDIAAILENPNTLTYLFLRFLRQYKDSPEMTVRLTGFDPTEVKEIKSDYNQRPIIGRRKSVGKNRVKFADTLHISETFDPDMYKRYNRSVTQYYLTEFAEVNRIKNELNFYKCHEMLVHAKSQCNTHFFY